MESLPALVISTACFLNQAAYVVNLPQVDRDLFFLRADLKRFPPLKECTHWIARGEEHIAWIDQKMLFDKAYRDRWETYRQQVVEWTETWRLMGIIQTPNQIVSDLDRMQIVRKTIGEENYARGHIPYPIADYFLNK